MVSFFINMPRRSLSVLLMILSGVCFVAMHSAAKYLADEVHIFEIVFFEVRVGSCDFVSLPF